jgi:glycosyltransferase involved in cell wall biosynthesis
VRIGVYTDYPYHRIGDRIYAERAFALFLGRLAGEVERLVVIGRLDPEPARARYALPATADFVPLPFYPRLSDPLPALRGMVGALRRFWRSLERVDAVWLLGPHPLAFPFAAMAMLRRKRVVLGVRQRFRDYVRLRHPNRRLGWTAALAMEGAFQILGLLCGVVAVGPAIAHDYRRSRHLLKIAVSLVEPADLVDPASVRDRSYTNRLDVLSVGRLDAEKNPLLLADILAGLCEDDPRWHLTVCGEGSLGSALDRRLASLGVASHADLRGYVSLDGELRALYRNSHALLHVSSTEGLPQVIFEAFAAGLPVVATDVGGIAEAVGDAVLLIPPGDADAAASALRKIADDSATRDRLIEAGHRLAASTTIDIEAHRVAAFLSGA